MRAIFIGVCACLWTGEAYALPTWTVHDLDEGVGAHSVDAMDLDGDGDIDIGAADQINDTLTVFENDGDQVFTKHVLTSAETHVNAMDLVDLDGDGDGDVISTTLISTDLVWWENDGAFGFTRHEIGEGYRCHAVDIDLDGDIDILTGTPLYSGDSVVAFVNDGSERFTRQVLASDQGWPERLRADDVDRDGDIDILVGAYAFGASVYWLEQTGPMEFTPQPISTDYFGWGVTAADLDDDGDTDAAAMFDDHVDWFENDGTQVFTAHTVSAPGAFGTWVEAADLDLDGDTDLMGGFINTNHLLNWWENDGTGGFTEHTVTEWWSPFDGLPVDVDGDGDLDLVVGHPGYLVERVRWYENERCPGADDALDGDGDLVPDDCDLCPGIDDRLDSDGDGTPDGCDPCPMEAYEVDNDLDGTWSCDDCNDDDARFHDGDGDLDGWSPCEGDCADKDPTAYPGAPERPDGVDNDCDGTIDEPMSLYEGAGGLPARRAPRLQPHVGP